MEFRNRKRAFRILKFPLLCLVCCFTPKWREYFLLACCSLLHYKGDHGEGALEPGHLTSGKLAIFTSISCGDFMEIWPIWLRASFPSAVTTEILSRDPKRKIKERVLEFRRTFSNLASKSLSIQIQLMFREISITSGMQMTPPLRQKAKRN